MIICGLHLPASMLFAKQEGEELADQVCIKIITSLCLEVATTKKNIKYNKISRCKIFLEFGL